MILYSSSWRADAAILLMRNKIFHHTNKIATAFQHTKFSGYFRISGVEAILGVAKIMWHSEIFEKKSAAIETS